MKLNLDLTGARQIHLDLAQNLNLTQNLDLTQNITKNNMLF